MMAGRFLWLAGLGMILLAGCAAVPESKNESEPSAPAASESKEQGEAQSKETSSANEQTINAVYVEARELAKKEGKLVLLKFSADWCAPCKEMSKDMKNDLLFVEEMKHYQVVEVDFDAEDSKDLKEKFYPEGGIPFVMVLRPEDESRVVDQTGYSSALQMVKVLKAAREKA